MRLKVWLVWIAAMVITVVLADSFTIAAVIYGTLKSVLFGLVSFEIIRRWLNKENIWGK